MGNRYDEALRHFEVMNHLEKDNTNNLEQVHNMYVNLNKKIATTKD